MFEALIEATRAQIKALDFNLGLIQEEIKRRTANNATDPKCPDCGIALGDENDVTCMGNARKSYVCPQCPFRGEI